MRAIEFRGKRLHDGKWVFGNPLIVDNDERKVSMIVTLHEAYPDTLAKVTTSVDIETVGQFTGMIDSAGRPIYEGDIVRSDLVPPMEVYYDGKTAKFMLRNEHRSEWTAAIGEFAGLEVIGNVYDNTDLLKGGEK